MKRLDLTGVRFGRLVACRLSDIRQGKNGVLAWDCLCDCLNIVTVKVGDLRSGNTSSCGCYRHEFRLVHGHTIGKQSRTYCTWRKMLARCYDPDSYGFHWYGARGIKVCERWLIFDNFLADMGERPEGMTLDRKETNGDYEPDNCRWATRQQQLANRRPRSCYRLPE